MAQPDQQGSPVFIGGRGLKHVENPVSDSRQSGSPVFIGGRGLKPDEPGYAVG